MKTMTPRNPLRIARRCCLAELLVLLALLVTPVRADQEGDFVFDRTGKTAVLTRYVGPDGAVVIPDQLGGLPVASIGSGTFAYRTALTSVTIPSSVTSIGGWAFRDCKGLTGVTIPNSVTSIGPEAFTGCIGLTSVTIPNSVTSIGWAAFRDCKGLTAFDVDPLNSAYASAGGVLFNKPQSVLIQYPASKVGPYTIPNSVIYIEAGAFYGCKGLTAFDVDPLNQAYASAGGVLFSAEQPALVQYPPGKVGPYTIPNGVTHIEGWAFSNCTGLTSVTIPNSVTSIGGYGFSGCTGLMSVTIGNGVTYIDEGAFLDCTNLASVYFEGDRPRVFPTVIFTGTLVTVFYRAGAAGWDSTFAGRPTAVWVPRPAYEDWAVSTGLAAQFPNARAEGDDPDGDGFTNGEEWFTGTDPSQHASRLELEHAPRTADLSESDRTPVAAHEIAVYFRSVPGRYYGVQRALTLGGTWELQGTRIASTTQTRFVLPRTGDHAFYRALALP